MVKVISRNDIIILLGVIISTIASAQSYEKKYDLIKEQTVQVEQVFVVELPFQRDGYKWRCPLRSDIVCKDYENHTSESPGGVSKQAFQITVKRPMDEILTWTKTKPGEDQIVDEFNLLVHAK